jgi:hypothetical protein
MAKIKEAIEDFKPDSRLVGLGTTRAEEALTSTASGGATTGDQRPPERLQHGPHIIQCSQIFAGPCMCGPAIHVNLGTEHQQIFANVTLTCGDAEELIKQIRASVRAIRKNRPGAA